MLVIATVGMTHGLLYSYDTVFSYIYRDDFRFSPAQSSFVDACNQFAWTIKPAFGALSDNFRLFGYQRKSYLILTAIICWICVFIFGLWVPLVALALIILLLFNISMSFENCMAEAVLVQNTQGANRKGGITENEKVKVASRGVSTWFGSQYIGKITGALLVMSFLQKSCRQSYLFWGSFAPLAGALMAFLLREKRRTKRECEHAYEHQNQIQGQEMTKPAEIELPHEIGRQEWPRSDDEQRLLNQNPTNNLKRAMQFLKNPLIFKSVLLVFLNGFIPESPQVKFYYYTFGLGFHATFIGALKFISYVVVFLGVLVYNRYLRRINLKYFYTGMSIICCLLVSSQLIFIFRLTIQLGISDKVFTAFDTFILELFGQFHDLPILVLACGICPKNIEATIFGLLMSVYSMGYMVSLQLGGLFTHLLGITSTNFENL